MGWAGKAPAPRSGETLLRAAVGGDAEAVLRLLESPQDPDAWAKRLGATCWVLGKCVKIGRRQSGDTLEPPAQSADIGI